MKKATTKKGVIKVANRAIEALKDLYEDAHSVSETRDAARGYLYPSLNTVNEIELFIKALEQ